MTPLTKIEEALMDDPQGHQLRLFIEKLDAEIILYTEELRKPNFQSYYEKIDTKRRACLSAINVIKIIWEVNNKK